MAVIGEDSYTLFTDLCFTSCCSSVVERGIAVNAIILRSVVRPSVAAFLLSISRSKKETVQDLSLLAAEKHSNKANVHHFFLTNLSIAMCF
jgi:hypothetical protein